jgi:ABC-type multidrug transport system fused ATPase/permease subunit
MGALTTIWMALTPALRRRCVLLQFLSLFMATSTVAGLAAVMTFLAVLTEPGLIEKHAALGWLWRQVGSQREFFLLLGGAFIALLVLSAVLNVFGVRAMGRLAHAVGDRIREVLFADYLRREFPFHARAGAGQLMDDVLYQSDRVTHTLFNAQLFVTNAALTLLVVASIAIVNPLIALLGVLVIGGSYLGFYRLVRPRVARNGLLQRRLGAERTAVVQQAFLGIKYLLIARAQDSFDRRFRAATRTLSEALADTNFIGIVPRFLLECMAGAVLIAVAAFAANGAVGGAWLAQLSFIAFAGFRLLPAVQQMYHAFVVMRANRATLVNLSAQLEGSAAEPDIATRVATKLVPTRSIELVDVSFRYAPEAPLVLEDVSVRIDVGTAIGIVGPSGCGKTTVADLLVGLLAPSTGRVQIDGIALDAQRVSAWQQAIGYVPQDVMLLDATVRENIAFGVDPADIDDVRLRQAAKQAGALAFIEALPLGFHTRTSGVGSSLSGGQRQRLGIARALYRDPALLLLDEATNALDADSERAIIDAVVRNRGPRTLVVVAHSAAAIQACDRVYELRDGKLHEHHASSQPRAARLHGGAE